MCCEVCNKWQHIRCHDQADFIAGRLRRDWDSEEFVCDACKTRTEKQTSHQHLRGKQLEQPSRLQLQSSSANYTHLPKLQLRPSYQNPQFLYPLYPQQPYASSQNWVVYNGNGAAGRLQSTVMAAESAVTSSIAPTTDNPRHEASNSPIHPHPH